MLWNETAQSRRVPSLSQILRILVTPPCPLTLSILSERPTWPQKPRHSLALDQSENLVTAHPGQKEENGATYPRDLSPGTHPTTAPSLLEGDGGGAQLVFLDMAQNIVARDITSWCLSSVGTYYFICMCVCVCL